MPGLRSIEVVLDDATEEIPPGVVLWTHRDDIGPGNDPTHRNWIDWMVATFPPDVCLNFTLLPVYHDNGRSNDDTSTHPARQPDNAPRR